MTKLICIAVAGALLLLATGASANNNLCANRQVGSFVRDVRDCRDYFSCNEKRQAIPGRCPAPFLFDEVNQKCNFATLVTCFNCPRDQAFVNIPVANTCNEYIRCVHNQPEHRVCPSDLLFDRELRQCNVPDAVDCAQEPVPECPATSDPANPIFFRDPEDCGRYTFCRHGTADRRQCPPGLHFNLRINQCDRPAAAGCIPEGDDSFDCAAQSPVLDPPLYADPNDCTRGFACAQGIARPIQCAKETVWNQEVQGCVVGACEVTDVFSGKQKKRPKPSKGW